MKPTSKEVIDELCKILNTTPKEIKEIKGFMGPKEKAKELVKKYLYYFPEFRNEKEYDYDYDKAKQCALIAVDMVIICCEEYDKAHETHTTQVDYWKEVKNEIEKL